MYSLYLVKKFLLNKSFILNNADLSIDSSIVKKMVCCKKENIVAVDTNVFNEENMKISVNDMGYISDISKKISENDAFACSIDFYKFSATAGKIFFDEIVRIIEGESNRKDWTEVAMQRLFASQTLLFEPFDIAGSAWVEIDNYEDLALSDHLFSCFDNLKSEIDAYYFDLDGTIYVGGKVIDGAQRVIKQLRSSGKKVFFLSNNSSKNKKDYVQKLRHLGIDCERDDFILSTDGLISFLTQNEVEKVFVLGTDSLKQTLVENGFEVCKENAEYVVLGYDTELTYNKLVDACSLINAGVDYIATHCDVYCPTEFGPIPDIGSFICMLEMTTSKSPKHVFGKPSPEMIKYHLEDNDFDPSRCAMVGDRLHTDVALAKALGMKSILVLTGETTRSVVDDQPEFPSVVLSSVADICCDYQIP
jgi:HAD superfamily hydrolase (TIGR01450 family)